MRCFTASDTNNIVDLVSVFFTMIHMDYQISLVKMSLNDTAHTMCNVMQIMYCMNITYPTPSQMYIK